MRGPLATGRAIGYCFTWNTPPPTAGGRSVPRGTLPAHAGRGGYLAGKKIEIGKLFGLFSLAPELIALVEAIKAAAADKHLSPEETEEVGKALIALVSKVLGLTRPAGS
jgi:hypothetical protein